MNLQSLSKSVILTTSVAAAFIVGDCAVGASVSSPDGRITATVDIVARGELSQVVYTIEQAGERLIDESAMVFVRDDGVRIGDQLRLVATQGPTTHHSRWRPVYGERSEVDDHYCELALTTVDELADCPMTVVFRCYDAGVAFHAVLGEPRSSKPLSIQAELTEFCFRADHDAWCTTSAQGEYAKRPISKLGRQIERPLVVRAGEHLYAAVAEAKLVDYARMKLRAAATKPFAIETELSSGVQAAMPLTTPWRVVMIAESPGKLLENNDILLNLNDPCAIDDTSWIKPGKVLRDITLTTAGAKACVDFAATHGLQYVELDAGWYGHEYDDAADATTVSVDPKRSPGPLDLHELIAYASKRDIGIILYVNRRALERQLDTLLPLYRSWGIKGVKFGFVNVGSQKWTSWLHDAVRKAAKHELLVDVHDEYRPTGYSRTYPNLLTQEGVRGDESLPSTEQALTTLFTRSLAGASDFTICYFDARVSAHWSHSHQLAKGVCFYSPWQFVFWYDTPLAEHKKSKQHNVILDTPELDFFRQMPTVWDETKVLAGEIGEYAVVARRSGDRWFVGALNNREPRTLQIPLSFLEADRRYEATIYRDDPAVDTPTQVGISRSQVDAQTTLAIQLGRNGGQAMIIEPAGQPSAAANATRRD